MARKQFAVPTRSEIGRTKQVRLGQYREAKGPREPAPQWSITDPASRIIFTTEIQRKRRRLQLVRDMKTFLAESIVEYEAEEKQLIKELAGETILRTLLNCKIARLYLSLPPHQARRTSREITLV